MYFPYLYDRQAEKLALIDVAPHLGAEQKVFPLVDPFTDDSGLAAVIGAYKNTKARLYIVVNPNLGAFADPKREKKWQSSMASSLADDTVVTPVFKITNATTDAQLTAFLDGEPKRRKAVLVASTVISPKDLATLVAGKATVTFLRHESNPVAYAAALGLDVTVDVDNSFPRQDRNSDYPPDDWFSDAHKRFVQDNRPGFSDFTVLPAVPQPGGGPPGAVAIHLTWADQAGELQVQHFLSDERDRTKGKAGSKILEAVAYIVDEVRADPTKFVTSIGLTQFLSLHTRKHETSLSKSKQHQISHHIYTVAKLLGA